MSLWNGLRGASIDLHFLGPYSGFAFEFLGGHEEVEQGNQWSVHGRKEGLFLKTLKPVIADVFADDRSVFLFNSNQRSASSC
jgi:hypothetical protein